MLFLNKLFLLIPLILPHVALGHRGPEVLPGDLGETIDGVGKISGNDERMLLQFTDEKSYYSFLDSNECVHLVSEGVVSENDVVVDLSDCESIFIPSNVEILASANLWNGGNQRR